MLLWWVQRGLLGLTAGGVVLVLKCGGIHVKVQWWAMSSRFGCWWAEGDTRWQIGDGFRLSFNSFAVFCWGLWLETGRCGFAESLVLRPLLEGEVLGTSSLEEDEHHHWHAYLQHSTLKILNSFKHCLCTILISTGSQTCLLHNVCFALNQVHIIDFNKWFLLQFICIHNWRSYFNIRKISIT